MKISVFLHSQSNRNTDTTKRQGFNERLLVNIITLVKLWREQGRPSYKKIAEENSV
jgi:hypothetical protein